MTAHFGYSNSGQVRRVQLPTLESVNEPVDTPANWNAWAAVVRSKDRTGVVGARLDRPVVIQVSNAEWAWRVFGLVMLAGIVLVLVI